MNCASRADFDDSDRQGWNKQPTCNANAWHWRESMMSSEETLQDEHGIANAWQRRDNTSSAETLQENIELQGHDDDKDGGKSLGMGQAAACVVIMEALSCSSSERSADRSREKESRTTPWDSFLAVLRRTGQALVKYAKFVGPGAMLSIAYIDPGNYATDVSAGATYRFSLLCVVLVSNVAAIFLQSLCVKLGSVTGLNLAENCKAHLPPWLNYVLYFFAECAIIATDIAEVIGTAIALNLLLHVPLVAGCAISIFDVLFLLLFYRPSGSMRGLRMFEGIVVALVLSVVICFCFQLSLIRDTSVGEVFRGYLPSHALVQAKGIYQACGILGATVMPHSLYLGSGIIQARLRDYDLQNGNIPPSSLFADADDSPDAVKYRPTLSAIRACLSYSVAELAISLFTFALFVNSAILIVAGSSLSSSPAASHADLFTIHNLLSTSIAPVAGTIFALALLLSGTSAGIVCTMAGQMVAEGHVNWRMRPWLRRLMTRLLAILPSIVIAGAVGRQQLSAALQGTQVALSVILPVISAPLIYFTCRNKYMTVKVPGNGAAAQAEAEDGDVKMRNGRVVTALAVLVWTVMTVMNGALLVLVGMGVA